MKNELKVARKVYEKGRGDAEKELAKMQEQLDAVREESRALGVLQKINFDNAQNELVKYVTLHDIKERKAYNKGGMTWDEFCEAIGENRRTVENKLKDVRPFVEGFSEKFSGLTNMPFKKVRYLGRTVSENFSEIQDGQLVVDGKNIPLTPDAAEDIEEAVDAIIKSHKSETKKLKSQVNRYKNKANKVVEAETSGLKTERDALVKEVERLKQFDPSTKDVTWAQDHLEEMKDLAAQFEVKARHMIMDERLNDAIEVQAKCQVFIDTMERMTRELRRDWDAAFNFGD